MNTAPRRRPSFFAATSIPRKLIINSFFAAALEPDKHTTFVNTSFRIVNNLISYLNYMITGYSLVITTIASNKSYITIAEPVLHIRYTVDITIRPRTIAELTSATTFSLTVVGFFAATSIRKLITIRAALEPAHKPAQSYS